MTPRFMLSRADDGTATYAAKLPPSSVPFTFRARLQDGRTRGAPGEVRFEARPVVKDVAAWLRLPAYVDPDGKRRYERFQPQRLKLRVRKRPAGLGVEHSAVIVQRP